MGKFEKNIITGFGGQFIAIILGLIIPRVFITNYGSDVNGLISTITQVFSYMALLEAGIGAAAQNALYKPFNVKDNNEISKVASIAKLYFRKFTVIYAFGVVVLSCIIPLILKSNVSAITISLIVLLEGMSGVISFYYIQTPMIILNVDGKSYVNNTIALVNKIVGYVVKIMMALIGLNIILLQLAYFVIVLLKVLVYGFYFKRHYQWIRFDKNVSNLKLRDRNSYILTEISWTIFSSTDMIVLSAFISTQLSSVYGIYNMIFSNISMLVNAVYMSVVYLLGSSFHESIDKYTKIHDSFNSVFVGIITVLMSVCFCLTIPFVSLYTKGVDDVDYIYTSLPIMFCLIQLLSWSRYVSGNLTGLAGYAKQTSYISLIEAIMNLSLSIIFVNKFGIAGVTMATVIALPIKVIWCIYIADKKVMKRSCIKSLSIIGVNFIFFFGVVFFSKYYQPTINSYVHFFLWGMVLTVIFGIVGMVLNFLVNKECWQVVRRYILKR